MGLSISFTQRTCETRFRWTASSGSAREVMSGKMSAKPTTYPGGKTKSLPVQGRIRIALAEPFDPPLRRPSSVEAIIVAGYAPVTPRLSPCHSPCIVTDSVWWRVF